MAYRLNSWTRAFPLLSLTLYAVEAGQSGLARGSASQSLQAQGGGRERGRAFLQPFGQLLAHRDAPLGLAATDAIAALGVQPLHDPLGAPDDAGKLELVGGRTCPRFDQVRPGLAPLDEARMPA